MLKVYIGYDSREEEAYDVARASLWNCSGIEAEPLVASRLTDAGLLWRITDRRGPRAYDLISNANKSTEFAVSRFLVPLICQSEFALFVDGDVVFQRDPTEMLTEIEPGKAVYCVQHDYTPRTQVKMDGQVQQTYPRKNWSSVMLFRTTHPANRRLSLHDVNTRPGRDLHRLYWANDTEVGALDPAWNWLVGETDKPDRVGICHFTLGGPWLQGWKAQQHDDIWHAANVDASAIARSAEL